MSSSPRAPRSRSPFAAAFLSLLFPGLGQAYAGAYMRGLGFAALPLLLLALTGGVLLRLDKEALLELAGTLAQPDVLRLVFVANIIALGYRIVAVIDAWQVARFLNAVDASGGGRLGRARLPVNPLSAAGLLATILVLSGGHVAVAQYDMLAIGLIECVSGDSTSADCEIADDTPSPGTSIEPADQESGAPTEAPSPTDLVQTPIGSDTGATPAPTLPPWNGTDKLNILLIGSDQRENAAAFNTDTLIVMSIDPESKQVAMFQVPRDTVDVPVPPNARRFWGSIYGAKVNSWYNENRNRPNLWPGKTGSARGFNSLKALLGQLYGLDIQYYVEVNFQGFRKVVDTLGGVDINVQIPILDNTYPAGVGFARRVYIPAGPQQMSGADALIYARSRHNSQGGDFDRGRRQQRVILSMREELSPQAILANLNSLVGTIKGSVRTDIPASQYAKLLGLADRIDTKNIRSYVFAPPYYASLGVRNGQDIVAPNISRIRAAVRDAFNADPALEALRERLGAEEAQAWVYNQSGRNLAASDAAGYLDFRGLSASAPNKRLTGTIPRTTITIYNGAQDAIPETIAYLKNLFHATVKTATDPKVTVDVVITLGTDAPKLAIDAPG